jgi:8-oxo-dGTP pyrophosphatase MutT (NUDIX family)
MARAASGSYKRRVRHTATPRTLLFLERDGLWLFLRGAPRKWFAGRLNGLGGSVEAGEGVLAAARRECVEETGLPPAKLRLAAVVHTIEAPPVLLFVCVGTLPDGALAPTPEGEHVWLPAAALGDPARPFVDDLRALFPRVTSGPPGEPPLSFTLRPPAELVEDRVRAAGRWGATMPPAGARRDGGSHGMMLHHCDEVLADPPVTGPCNVNVTSGMGPGTVDVIDANGAVAGSVRVPGGGTVLVGVPGPVKVHYKQGLGGPVDIDAEVQQLPV